MARGFSGGSYVWKIEVTADNMGPVIDRIDLFAEAIGKLYDPAVFSSDSNPVKRTVDRATALFLVNARKASPRWTGLLIDTHTEGEEEYRPLGNYGIEGEKKVFIDPAVTTEHPYLGDIPSRYGPRYHDEVRPWFDEAEEATWPEFIDIVNSEFGAYLEGALF